MGTGLFVFGLYLVRMNSKNGVAVVALGTFVLCLAVLLPAVSEAELGVSGLKFKTTVTNRDQEFAPFVERERSRLMRFCYLLVGDAVAATSIVDDALSGAWEEVTQHDPAQLYLHALCWTVHLATRRQALTGAEVYADTDDPDDTKMMQRLAQMPLEQRAVALLCLFEGLEADQVAHIMSCPRAKVEDGLQRIKAGMDVATIAAAS